MPLFYIIDQLHCLHLQDGKSLTDAKDKFNDKHVVRLDVAVEHPAQLCCHKRYLKPDLPVWMEYSIAPNCNICSKCYENHE